MVRSRVVSLTFAPLLAAVAVGAPSPALGASPFDALLGRVATTAPGTYVVTKAAFLPAPEEARIPMLLQADVLRGTEKKSRVGVAVAAQAPRAVDVRLRVWTVASGREAARVVADADGPGAGGPMRFVRDFNLAPGDYDLEAVIGDSKASAEQTVAIARSRLTVPDVRGESLAVTPIVAGDAATAARRADAPFIFGRTTLTPAVSPRFSQGGAMSVAFRVYNWTAKPEEKPDLTVEYLFYEQGTKGMHFFNKVKPQQLNGDTLGTAFDPAAGSVAAGMMIPLGSFTFGDFQLAVKVTDNRNKRTAEQKLAFAVAP